MRSLALFAALGCSGVALADGLPWNTCVVYDGGLAYLDAGAACFTCTQQCGVCTADVSGGNWTTCVAADGGTSCPAGTPQMQCEQVPSTSGTGTGGTAGSGSSSGGGSSGGASSGGASGSGTTGGGSSSGGDVHAGGCSTGAEFGSWFLAGLPLLLLARRKRR